MDQCGDQLLELGEVDLAVLVLIDLLERRERG
jgi:hypothetical protein